MFTIGFCYVTKHSHTNYESIILELMKPTWLHFKALKGHQPGMCIFLG